MEINRKFQAAYQKISAAQEILLVGHVSPDHDALASLGVMLALSGRLSIKTLAYAGNKPSSGYEFVPYEKLVSSDKPTDLSKFSVIIILDCGSLARTGLELEIKEALANRKISGSQQPFFIELDHHEPHDHYADIEIRLPHKASTTEIIYDFFQANNLEINKIIADCILIGLMADTGNFLHPNASFSVLAVSSQMLLKGASLSKISSQLRSAGSLLTLKIWGLALERLRFDTDTGFASTALFASDLENLISSSQDSSSDVFGDIASFISYLGGVRVALVLREEGGRVKGSLRANGEEFDVAAIARQFGGGGHKRSAGFSVPGKLQDTGTGWRVIKN